MILDVPYQCQLCFSFCVNCPCDGYLDLTKFARNKIAAISLQSDNILLISTHSSNNYRNNFNKTIIVDFEKLSEAYVFLKFIEGNFKSAVDFHSFFNELNIGKISVEDINRLMNLKSFK